MADLHEPYRRDDPEEGPEAGESQFEGLTGPGGGRVLDKEKDDAERHQERPGDAEGADLAGAQI